MSSDTVAPRRLVRWAITIAGLALALGAQAPCARAQTVTKLPMPQSFTTDEIRVQWETDSDPVGAEHVVEWGLAGTGENTTPSSQTIAVSAGRFVHRATLAGLSAGTQIQYRVRSGSDTTATFSLSTAPEPGAPFRMAWLSDNQNQAGTSFEGVLGEVVPFGVDFIGHAGDTVQTGTDVQQWHDDWYTPLANAASIGQEVPILVARGNHDGESSTAYAYHWLPGNGSWHASTIGPLRLVVLDSNLFGFPQTIWLEAELASTAAQEAEFLVVAFHRPPYTRLWDNPNGYNGENYVRVNWVPLFEQYGVDLVVSGHAHAYQRGAQNGVIYTTVGGAGGLLDTFTPPFVWELLEIALSTHHYVIMDVDASTLEWNAYDLNGNVIDQFVLGGPPAVPALSGPWRLVGLAMVLGAGMMMLASPRRTRESRADRNRTR